MQIQDVLSRQGQTVYDSTGSKIGKIEDIFVDDDTQQPEWIGVDTGGIFGSKHVLVPIEGAEPDRDGLKVAYTKDLVKDAPDIGEDEIPIDREEELYEHYGLRQLMERTRSSRSEPARGDISETQTGRPEARNRSESPEIVTHEEQLRVGARDLEAGRVRLRKHVETRPVEEQVRLRQETAHLEREEINEPASSAAFEDEEVEMELRRQEPVVSKETVAKERVGLRRDVEETSETVRDEVRSEEVDIEGDIDETRGRRSGGNRDPFGSD